MHKGISIKTMMGRWWTPVRSVLLVGIVLAPAALAPGAHSAMGLHFEITGIDAKKGVVTARKASTGAVAEFPASAAAPKGSVEPIPPLHVTLSVSPAPSSFPYGNSPKVGDGTQITLTAQPAPGPFVYSSYSFTAALPSGETFVIQNHGNQAKWAPPKGGDYNFNVVVRQAVSQGSATVNNYHVRPSLASTATVFASPPQKGFPGAFSITAMVPLRRGAMMNRFWFSFEQQFVPPPPVPNWQGPANTVTNTAVWNPNPQLVPGLYFIRVYVQSFMDNVLIAEGFGSGSASQPDFYWGYYTVLLPLGPCPRPTQTADPSQPFGWLKPITTQNTSELVATPQGSANCAIAGHNINDITNNPQLRVRKINVSCSNCHIGLMAGTVGRSWFCMQLPGNFPHRLAPDNETTLYNIFINWQSRGCPD